MELMKMIKYLDKKFNPKLASNWDKSGFQIIKKEIIDISRNINKILICLDATKEVIEYSIDNQIDLIISRHPFIFNDLKDEMKTKKEMIKLLNKNNIDIYSIHTNFDASPNQNIISLLSEEFDVLKTKRFGQENEGYNIKLKKEIKPHEFIENMQKVFKTNITQLNSKFNMNQNISEFNIITGSGGSSMLEEKIKDCVFVTGEIKWNELVYANDNDVSVLILGHYMEEYFVDYLNDILNNNFNKEIEIIKFDIHNQIINYK